MFKLTFLEKENDLNKIIKSYRKDKDNLSILFISLWDDYCSNLVNKLKDKYKNSARGEDLYVVDSFSMPHSFVIYNTTKIPHLVQLRKKHSLSEDYLPNILNKLKIK
jgi:hypothetical protein